MRIGNFFKVAQLVQERSEIQIALEGRNPGKSMLQVDMRWSSEIANRVIEQALPIIVQALQERLKEIDAELVELGMSID